MAGDGKRSKWLAVPVIVGCLVTWHLATLGGSADRTIVPTPGEVWDALSQMAVTGELSAHLLISLRRVLTGLGIAVLLGVSLGLALGTVRPLSVACGPLFHFLRQIPPIAWIPVFILWFGIEETSRLAVIVYAAFFPVFLSVLCGASSVSPVYLQMGDLLEFNRVQQWRYVVIPALLPSLFAGVRLALSSSWRALVAAEMLAASGGLGYLIMESRYTVSPAEMFTAILVIGLVGLLLDVLLAATEERISCWRQDATTVP